MAMTKRGSRASNQLMEWAGAIAGKPKKKKSKTGVNADRGAARRANKGKQPKQKLKKGVKLKPGVDYTL
jgi:hypothetical protein